ncbi:MAG: UDP-3-O-(3-hydroxymyristoyl)glucosamine N-acyltransferase [bacterium]|nr:UDP-3-O-(3-hydroxymyristoyl)glucosamine N-acyltransferase [bacterium]
MAAELPRRESYRLGELAERVAGTVRGDPEVRIAGLGTLDRAGPEDLSFLTRGGAARTAAAQAEYRRRAEQSRAAALLVAPEVEGLDRPLLVAADPSLALARLIALFYPTQRPPAGVHPTAVVGDGCEIDPSAHVGPYAVIGDGSRIGAGAALHAHVVLGRECRVGPEAILYPQVVLYDRSEVAERSIVHAGVVIGADGFGFATHGGEHVKVPQVGRAVVEADVEIGANSAVDRATLEETRVGAGTKIDNLVQVGHNVEVGRGCILCGQVGLAGSARLGDFVVMGGQAGSAGHITIGNGVQVAAKTAVFQSVPDGGKVGGIPAVDLAKWRRQAATVNRIGELLRRLRALEKQVKELETLAAASGSATGEESEL